MNRITVFLLALVTAAPVAAAELYRWIDEKGGVHYSDQPPPASVKNTTRVGVPAAGTSQGSATSATRPPVVLYSAACGAPCDQAADYLRQRGVPFTLKAVDQDPDMAAELRKRTGSHQVPVLYVGETVQRGFAASIWDKMLEVAGYAAPAAKPGQPAAKP